MPKPTDSYPQPFAAVAAVDAATLDEAPEGFNAVQEFLGRFGYLTDDTKIPSTGPEGEGHRGQDHRCRSTPTPRPRSRAISTSTACRRPDSSTSRRAR